MNAPIKISEKEFYNNQMIKVFYLDKEYHFQLELKPKLIRLTLMESTNPQTRQCILLQEAPVIFTEDLLPESIANEYGRTKIREILTQIIQQ